MRMKEKTLSTMLYRRILTEQELFRNWLCVQMPEEMLKHAEEYVIRERILQIFDEQNLCAEQANALVQLNEPLAFLCQKIREEEAESLWDRYLGIIQNSANKLENDAREAEAGGV